MTRRRIAIVLASCAAITACSRSDNASSLADAEEARARDRFAKKKLDEANAGRVWGVSSTSEVQFDEGFGNILYDPEDQSRNPSFHNHAFRWIGQHAHVRLKTHGDHPMKLTVAGWVHENVIRSKPVMSFFIDGFYVFPDPKRHEDGMPIEPPGHYAFEFKVPSWMLHREWVDLIVRTSSVAFHWGDPPELNVALVYYFSWSELDPSDL
jgi:hypothetical protein